MRGDRNSSIGNLCHREVKGGGGGEGRGGGGVAWRRGNSDDANWFNKKQVPGAS